MIHFVDNNGTIIKTIESPVYQGSAESNNIILIAPFAANLQFTVAFFLPNGEITPRYAMTQGGTLNGVEYAPTNGAMAIWTFSMPSNITQYYGTVYAQFYAYGTNGQITASSRTSFVVARGVPEELPDTPDQTIYNQILTALSQINTALNNGSYAARAIYWWINTYTYGMNEITFYPIGTYGAFVRSTVTGNTGNQPYTDDGVLNSEHWEELVNFNKIYAAEQNAIAQAQAAAESAQNAEESASAAAQSASSAAQSAQTAEKYAADAEEAGSKFSDLVNSGEIGNFVIQGEENKLTWSPNLWDYPNYLQVAKDVYVSETLSSGVRISYESIEVFRSDGDRFTSYEIGQIRDVSEESYNRTFALPSQAGTLALTSDVAAEASERESADNALQSDIDGIQQQLSETQHFRGYYETTAQVQSISNPHSGDYAWNAQTGTVWNYSTSWSDSGVAIPDQTVPKSSTTPLMDGTATLGSTNTYADGGHRHPTDTTRASVIALNSETESRTAADSNLQSQIDDIKDGTTVVEQAQVLSKGLNVGGVLSTATAGYYKFATISKLANYQQANARLEISDTNIANYSEQVCGIELRYYTSPTAPNRIDVAVLYGNPAILDYIYVSILESGGAELYYYARAAGYTGITVKTLYQVSRQSRDSWDIFENTNDSIPALPTTATNTVLPELEHYEITTVAKNLVLSAAVGSSAQPVYFSADGVPVACGDELDVSVTGGASALIGTAIAENTDLHTLVPVYSQNLQYYYCGSIATAGTLINCPVTVPFVLVSFAPQVTGNRFIQRIYSIDEKEFVSFKDVSNTWSDWKQAVYADGNYPTLGAGYLGRNAFLNRSNGVVVWEVGKVNFSDLSAYRNTGTYSCIMLVNGSYQSQNTTNPVESGIIELDFENRQGALTAGTATISILAGNLKTNKISFIADNDGFTLYYITDDSYETAQFTIISEIWSYIRVNCFSFTMTGYGTSAPSGAIYAVNRNVAEAVANAVMVNNLQIKRDENGVLKIGDIIIPQKELIWSGSQAFSEDTAASVTLDSVEEGDTLEIVCEYGVAYASLPSAGTVSEVTQKFKVDIGASGNTLLGFSSVNAENGSILGKQSLTRVFFSETTTSKTFQIFVQEMDSDSWSRISGTLTAIYKIIE